MPTADHNQADDLPTLLGIGGNHSSIDLRDQFEYRLDPFISQGGPTILDFTELSIGKQYLQDRAEDMAFTIVLFLDHLTNCEHFCKLVLPHGR